MDKDYYSLEELIEHLENMRDNPGETFPLNYPKAFYCLAKEIQELKSPTFAQISREYP